MELRTIAILDDDSTTRKVLQWVLERDGYAVVSVTDAEETIGLCHEPRLGVCALIADVRLRTEITGIDIAIKIRKEIPDLPVLITSGTPPEGWTQKDFANFKILLAGRADFLAKPFTAGALTEKMAALVSGRPASGIVEIYKTAELHRNGITAAVMQAQAAEQKPE